MKKFILLTSLCLIAFSVFGQNSSQNQRANSLQANTVDGFLFNQNQSIVHSSYVPSNTPIVLAPQEQIIGKTKYDTQTNSSFGSRFYRYPDGRMVAAWTGGVQSPPNFPDRGSFINYFDGTDWTINPDDVVRIENERSGWPSWAPLGSGEVLASHNAATVNIWTREIGGKGAWVNKSSLPGTNVWARICVNEGVIHLITVDNTGDNVALFYSKSTDGGATWNPQRARLSTILPNFDYADFAYRPDSYVWAEPNNGIIALSIAGDAGDFVIYKSADNGTTWEKKTVWMNPFKNQSEFMDELHSARGPHGLIIDDDGICHVAFYSGIAANPGSTYLNQLHISRAFYWNETMAPFVYPIQENALDPELNPQLHTDDRLILDISFNGENFDETQMVCYSPVGMIHKIHMASAGPNRLIIVMAIQDHTSVHPTNNYFYSRIFACSYVKDGSNWKFDTNWSDDLTSWGHPGWLRVNKDAHTNENCTHPQIVVEKTDDDTGMFHIFFMVDDMPGGALEGLTGGTQNPQNNIFTDNYFVVYSDYVNFVGPIETPPTITTNTLPNAKEGEAYNQTLAATGSRPITWSLLEEDTLPLGLSLEPATGKITGVPTEKHILYEFTVKATNAFGEDTKRLSIFVDSVVVSIASFENSAIMIYPNPVSDILHIVNSNQQNMQISLFDFLGREVLNQNASDKAELDISKLPAGIYNIRIQHGNAIVSRKVVKK